MDVMETVELNELCRICSNIVNSDEHLLSENNKPTKLGEMFETCFDIQLKTDIGYPNALCNYCQLQLNMFYAFVEKAKLSNSNFTSILENANVNKPKCSPAKRGRRKAIAAEVEDEIVMEELLIKDEIDEIDESQQVIEIEEEELTGSSSSSQLEIIGMDENEMDVYPGNESDYSIEYLESEYIDTFENETNSDSEKAILDPATEEKIQAALKRAEKRKTGKRQYPYQCAECSKRFVYKEVYEGHMRTHKGLPAFSCPQCPKTFAEKANFDYHMQDHTNYRPAKCPLCDKCFKNKQDLASHIRCHQDIRKYMCDVCGKRFRSQSHMAYHRYSHFEERNFRCDKCSQAFKSPHILKTHRNTVHSNVYRYECELCGRKFKRDHHLVAHRRTHSKDPLKGKKSRKKVEVKKEPIAIIETVEEIVDI